MWLHDEAEIIDTTNLTAAQAALQIADAINRCGTAARE